MGIEGIAILVITFLVLLIIGVPIAFSIGLAGITTMLVSMDFLPAVTTFAQRMANGLDSFTLLAIPFFILAGQLMNKGGIAIRLIDLAKALVGRFPGGLAFVNVIANMLFGAISGSAVASASAIGSTLHPKMVEEGYDKNFSAAVNISSATIGLVIPPSNVLIVYSLASGGVSIAALFVAGYLPGILMGLLLMAVGAAWVYKENYPKAEKVSFSDGVGMFFKALPGLLLVFIVIGGIIAGWFTATEASAVAVLYAFLLSLYYREIKLSDFKNIVLDSAKTTSVVLFLVAASLALSWVMAYENLPQEISASILSISSNEIVILLLINLILLFVGTFMDVTPAVLIFTPIFLPIVTEQLGMDPIHFGIVLVMNLCVGLTTPPVGSVLFVGCSVADIKIEDVIKPLLPFYAAMILCLLLVTYIPELSLWLPRIFGL
ncbi:MAG: TRAP transporter large permease [Flavobacteriales bacterium]|nr:TRAP transporter large permease [Flavobacteriales bacterium]